MKWILLTAILTLSTNIFANNADPVVAEVNGKKIKKSTLLSYHKQNLNFIQNKKKINLETSLNDLVDRIIGIDAAKKAQIDKRPDVIKKMNDIVYHAFISDELAPKLNKIKVTDNEIKTYYKANPEYRTSQILLRLRTLPSEEEVAQALEAAQRIYNQARKDMKKNPNIFAELAQKYGQTTTAPIGGDMGYQPKVRLSTEYYAAIKGKKKGYIPNPFRTQYGIHVVMVTGEKTYEQIDKDLYKKIIYDEKRDAILAKYFADKRKASKVKINKQELVNE